MGHPPLPGQGAGSTAGGLTAKVSDPHSTVKGSFTRDFVKNLLLPRRYLLLNFVQVTRAGFQACLLHVSLESKFLEWKKDSVMFQVKDTRTQSRCDQYLNDGYDMSRSNHLWVVVDPSFVGCQADRCGGDSVC